MHNTLVFFTWIVIDLAFLLAAFALWGELGVVSVITASVVMMNLFVLKGMQLFGLDATGGNVLYASIFLGTDILTEYYGPQTARRGVMIGFFFSVLFLAATRFILLFQPAEWDLFHPHMKELFTPVWRVTGASMLAYLASQHLDVFTYHRLKLRLPRLLWLRNNGSTLTSQAVDSLLFCTAAFAGVYPARVVAGIVLSTYLLKAAVALLDTPFLYLTRVIVRLRGIPDKGGTP
jgi:hypothetical protein